ncbi:MAG: GNAT family N-acetyltransferase [Promethearchaeota archaeon]
MIIRPFNKTSDKTGLIEVYDKSVKVIRPGARMNEEIFNNVVLTVEDQTDLSKDCLVVEDKKGKLIGFAGLFKSSERDSWNLIYHTLPKYHKSKLLVELFKSLLKIIKAQTHPKIIFEITKHNYIDSPLQAMIMEMGLEPVHFHFRMQLDDIKEVPKSIIPNNITFQNEKELIDYASYISVLNDAFKDHFEFRPFTEEKYKSVRRAAEKQFNYLNCLAYDGNELIGVCTVAINPKTKHLGRVAILGVLQKYHHLGIGSALLDMGIQSLNENGCKTIDLGVEAKNEKALSLYKKFGFHEVESRTEITFAIE